VVWLEAPRVCNPVSDGGPVQRHGAECVGEGLLVPTPSLRVPRGPGGS
jgi:hypothetical protein